MRPDALELMTGHSAGRSEEERVYTKGSLMARAVERAKEFWKLTMSGPKRLSKSEPAGAGDDEQPIPPQESDRE